MGWATAQIQNPGEVKLTVSLTMPFDQWRILQNMLANVPAEHQKHPMWPVRDALAKAIAVAADKITEKVELL